MSKVPSIEELDEKIQQRVTYLAERDPQICTLRGAKEMLLALHDNGQENKADATSDQTSEPAGNTRG